jgi:hypothetical protein
LACEQTPAYDLNWKFTLKGYKAHSRWQAGFAFIGSCYHKGMKSESHTSPEFDRFYKTLKALVAVPQTEIKAEMEKYKRERAAKKKKRAKS